ncbi:MAG: CNNM domain-containing protein [Victivallales bacterium]|nr:CNNM domain-containing protein [Victivallales bacterium]
MIYLLLTIVFILFQAFFSGMETGLISMRKPRVLNGVAKNDRRAGILLFFMERPSLMLSSTLLGTNICVVCASLTAKQAAVAFGFDSGGGMLAASLLLTVTLLAAEIIPKDWFRQEPYLRGAFFAPLFYSSYLLLYVPAWLLARFTDRVVGMLSRKTAARHSELLLREDFRLLLRESEEGGIIDSDNADLLDNAVDFSRTTVGEIMVPVPKVHTVAAAATVREAVAACRRSGCSRLPLVGADGKWVGIFSLYDAIYQLSETEWDRVRVETCRRPLVDIGAEVELGQIIRRSQETGSPLLVVADPSHPGDYLGIVTPLDVVGFLFNSGQ